MVPAHLCNLDQERDPRTITWREKLLCWLGTHAWVRHRDSGWDAGYSEWCPRCGAEWED